MEIVEENKGELSAAIRKWTTVRQRLEIAKEFGVYSTRQIYNVINFRSKNFELLERLVQKAEENKNLMNRAYALSH